MVGKRLVCIPLQNEWIDFDQACTVILLRQGQELISFIFKVTRG